MEYLLNNKKCKKIFNKEIVEKTLMCMPLDLKPMFDAGNFKDLVPKIIKKFPNPMLANDLKKYIKNGSCDKSVELLLWRYYCCSTPNINIIASLEKIKVPCLYKFEVPISEKQLEYIKLQINFIRMKFSDFVEYLFDLESSNRISQFKESNKTKILTIGISSEKIKNALFVSNNFYEVVQSSKIFLNWNNYDLFEKQISYVFSKQLDHTIKLLFNLRYLNYYFNTNFSLIDQEYFFMGGSYLLFAMGFRISRDIDIYCIEGGDKILKYVDGCGFEVTLFQKSKENYNSWNTICLYPSNYYILFGLKANIYEIEINKRLKRYQIEGATRPLADLLALLYYFNKQSQVKIKINKNKLDKIFNFKYRFLDPILIKKFINSNENLILE